MTHAGYRDTGHAREARRLLGEVFLRSLPAPAADEYSSLLVDELIELMADIASTKLALHEAAAGDETQRPDYVITVNLWTDSSPIAPDMLSRLAQEIQATAEETLQDTEYPACRWQVATEDRAAQYMDHLRSVRG